MVSDAILKLFVKDILIISGVTLLEFFPFGQINSHTNFLTNNVQRLTIRTITFSLCIQCIKCKAKI